MFTKYEIIKELLCFILILNVFYTMLEASHNYTLITN